MKKIGILHTDLSYTIASMGHLDLLVIGDAGLPVPPGVALIDLALKQGVPGFLETLAAVLGELHVQEAIIDVEQGEVSPAMAQALKAMWPPEIPLRALPHQGLQEMAKSAKAVVRTGEFTPYANIVLVAGVLF